MRHLLALILLTLPIWVQGQTIDNKKLMRVNQFGIDTTYLNLADYETQIDLHLMLKKDRQIRSNKIAGYSLLAASAISTTVGIVLINKYVQSGEPLILLPALMISSGGPIYGGISIPFFIQANKKKKERDNLIKTFKY